jgi:D-aminoacyl-tRNA deacylase
LKEYPRILKSESLSANMVTLLLASSEDPASMNILSKVMEVRGWGVSQSFSHGQVTGHSSGNVDALLIDGLHIWADGIDSEHESVTGSKVDEIFVLSKHVSASETPALTLHAVGVPGEYPHGEKARSGGITGTAVPPSTRFGELFRTMSRIATELELDKEYDLTLEATHHGPLLETPTLYLEIGSTAEQWSDERAARVWSETISLCLGMSEGSTTRKWDGKGDVMIGLGGGHYAPRHKAVISASEVWVGHILANYAIVFEEQEGDSTPLGPWTHSVRTAVESTRIAFPGGDVFAHLDRKSFKGWQRQALISLLSELGVPVLRGKQISLP